MVGMKRLTFAIAAAFGLGACSSLPSMGDLRGGSGNYADGSLVESNLSGSDRAALAAAFTAAMDTGETRNWRGGRAVGVVTPGGYALANLQADPNARIGAARGDFDLAHVMETEMGLYVLTRNSNIRTGPGTDNPIAEVLPSGAGVDVVGQVTSNGWMLVAVDDQVRGYISPKLLIKAPGTELELAGGPRRRPILCREFSQRIVIFSQRDEWTGAACNDGVGWRLAPPEPEPVEEEDDLLGL